jgi:competence protein ComFB
MAFIDKYNLENLRNETEKLVFDELEKQIMDYSGEICRCNDCIIDMAAVALNTVKPLYRHSLLGTLYTAKALDNKEYAVSITEAVAAAIEKVRKNPSHN